MELSINIQTRLERMSKTPLIKMIALVVMTSLLQESWCLIGLIGAPPHSVNHHPRGLLMAWPTPHPIPSSDHKSEMGVTITPHQHGLLHSFRCQTRALKSLIRNPSSPLGDVQNWIRFCSQNPNDVKLSHCKDSVQQCATTSATELLSVPGCSSMSRMLKCLGNTMTSCFKSPRAAMSVFRRLHSICIRHRPDSSPKIN